MRHAFLGKDIKHPLKVFLGKRYIASDEDEELKDCIGIKIDNIYVLASEDSKYIVCEGYPKQQ